VPIVRLMQNLVEEAESRSDTGVWNCNW